MLSTENNKNCSNCGSLRAVNWNCFVYQKIDNYSISSRFNNKWKKVIYPKNASGWILTWLTLVNVSLMFCIGRHVWLFCVTLYMYRFIFEHFIKIFTITYPSAWISVLQINIFFISVHSYIMVGKIYILPLNKFPTTHRLY